MSEQAPTSPSTAATAAGATPVGPTQRRIAQVASTAFIVAIVLMVNYLAYRHYDRLDLTSEGLFTLSPKSVEVIGSLTEPVDIYLFLSQNEQAFGRSDELLKRYVAISPMVRVHYVDPDREPAEFKVQAQRFGVMSGVLQTGEAMADVAAVVARGDKHWHVSRDDLVGFEFAIPGQKQDSVEAQAEMALTGAVVQVTSGRPTQVCVSEGHGEWTIDPGTERSLGALKEHTRHDNLEWKPLKTLGLDTIPEDCDALLVISPVAAFSAAEAALLDAYVRAGGNMLLALDPVIERDEIRPSGLEGMLQKHGVRLEQSLVIELSEERLLSPNPIEFIVTEFNAHETTTVLQGRGRVLMALVRGVTPDGSLDGVLTLMRTSDEAFGETNLGAVGGEAPGKGPEDLAGPVSLAVARRVPQDGDSEDDPEAEKAPGGRMIVVGDSDFLAAQLLDAPELANYYLVSSWMGWLTERKALIAIPPKKVRGGAIMLTQDSLMALFVRAGVLLPGAALFLGIAAWLNRRS